MVNSNEQLQITNALRSIFKYDNNLPRWQKNRRHYQQIFVTVGTTLFDALPATATEGALADGLARIHSLIIQYGRGALLSYRKTNYQTLHGIVRLQVIVSSDMEQADWFSITRRNCHGSLATGQTHGRRHQRFSCTIIRRDSPTRHVGHRHLFVVREPGN
jgi:hypothetical protein